MKASWTECENDVYDQNVQHVVDLEVVQEWMVVEVVVVEHL